MKLDITKMPVLEAVIGFLLIVVALTFFLAFKWVNDQNDSDGAAVAETPSPTSNGPAGNTVAVSLGDNFFDPDQITVAADQEIAFNVTNDGSAVHNMRIAGADNEFDSDDDAVSDPEIISGGKTGVVSWQSPAAGAQVDFRCDFHPAQMTGVITVQ